jgi:hypothetical protein
MADQNATIISTEGSQVVLTFRIEGEKFDHSAYVSPAHAREIAKHLLTAAEHIEEKARS